MNPYKYDTSSQLSTEPTLNSCRDISNNWPSNSYQYQQSTSAEQSKRRISFSNQGTFGQSNTRTPSFPDQSTFGQSNTRLPSFSDQSTFGQSNTRTPSFSDQSTFTAEVCEGCTHTTSVSDRGSVYTASIPEQNPHLKQCETVIRAYSRLRVCFIVLVGFNVILIITICIAVPVLLKFFQTTVAETKELNDRSKSQYGCSSCNAMKDKFKDFEIKGALENLPDTDGCCFNSAEETLAFLAESVTTMVDGWIRTRPKIHAESKRKPKGYKSPTMLWQKSSNHPATDVKLVNSTYFRVPVNGYYFLYNRIQFRLAEVEHRQRITHGLSRIRDELHEAIQSVVLDRAKNDTTHTSMIQSVFHFRKSDLLYVKASPYHLVDDRREDANYFGLFLVSL
ncbi:hypothetical protein ScPMuIL_018778 [Solemya velum]